MVNAFHSACEAGVLSVMSIESDMIHVEVVYALPHEQRVFTLVVNQERMTVEGDHQASLVYLSFILR